MSWIDEKPWLKTAYDNPEDATPIPLTPPLDLWIDAVNEVPEHPAIYYYGTELTYSEVDRRSNAFAAYLSQNGFGEGDPLGVYLQNVPHYMITVIAVWKLGGVVVPLNPMYRDELDHIFSDSGVKALVVSAAAYMDRVKDHAGDIPLVVTVGEHDFVTTNEPAIFDMFPQQIDTGKPDFLAVLKEHDGATVTVNKRAHDPDAVGLIGYTSGTSGKSKGALLPFKGLGVNSLMLVHRYKFEPKLTFYQMAPVFHITGFVCIFLSAISTKATLVLNYRFDPAVALKQFRETRPVYMAGPATAFTALLTQPDFTPDDFSSFRSIMSGGAALPEGLVKKFEERAGIYVGQGYGLTETSAQCITVPHWLRAPVDPESGNLSCGLPSVDAHVRIAREDGSDCDPGEVGEVYVSGPMVAHCYLNNPTATETDIPDGELHTGDVGFMDKDGWVYIVDRKKDMINASGFKVWPREVEDVLYLHPAVSEAAVVGVPDDYRGENVVAFVTRRAGEDVTEDQIIEHCRAHLAAYKAPRQVNFIDALPKTASGKILRREMRAVAADH